MKNVGNLYKTSNRGEASIIADIEATKDELIDIVDEIDGTAETTTEAKAEVKKFKRASSFPIPCRMREFRDLEEFCEVVTYFPDPLRIEFLCLFLHDKDVRVDNSSFIIPMSSRYTI